MPSNPSPEPVLADKALSEKQSEDVGISDNPDDSPPGGDGGSPLKSADWDARSAIFFVPKSSARIDRLLRISEVVLESDRPSELVIRHLLLRIASSSPTRQKAASLGACQTWSQGIGAAAASPFAPSVLVLPKSSTPALNTYQGIPARASAANAGIQNLRWIS